MIKGTGAAAKQAVTDDLPKTLIMALVAAMFGVGGSAGFQLTPAHNDGDQELSRIERQLDEHIRRYERTSDKHSQMFVDMRRDIMIALYTDNPSILSGAFMSAPPAAMAEEAAEPEEFEIEE